jgi:ubiquinone/menaquinone biosynthesis C-methylase UbiE
MEAATARDVLDVGCGIGKFTLEIAKRARKVVGIDFSEEAIGRAKRNQALAKQENARFEFARADRLPFADETFDLVVSRRGPVTDSVTSLSEAYRVLRIGGRFLEITIGEKDKANITKIFGRGQMFGVKERIAVSKSKMLKAVGFKVVEIRDYLATEIFQSMQDLIIRLNSAPIIPSFDVNRDARYLELVEKRCKTRRGIETEVHRVTIIAAKEDSTRSQALC